MQAAKRILILDGGTGRELHAIGAPFQQPEWSALALIKAPEFVTAVHARFVAAGCDVITTNSFAVVPYHLGSAFELRGAELARLAGVLAREAAGSALVAGSLPPVAGSYRPEAYDAAESMRVLRILAEAMEPYVDVWLAETMSCLDETRCAHFVVASMSQKPLWIAFTVDDCNGSLLRSGERVQDAVDAASRWPGVEAVLFNCSTPTAILIALQSCKDVQAELPVRLGAYANAFAPRASSTPASNAIIQTCNGLSPQDYAEWAQKCVALGCSIVGGCCGVSPDHIASLSAALHDRES